MTTDAKAQSCPECGGIMRHGARDELLTYKGESRVVQVLGWWCTTCGEAIFTGEPLLAHERAFQEFKAEVDAWR